MMIAGNAVPDHLNCHEPAKSLWNRYCDDDGIYIRNYYGNPIALVDHSLNPYQPTWSS